MLAPDVRTTVARWLEAGVMSGPCGRALARVHAPFARRAVRRPLDIPRTPGGSSIVTITVGGATMGGSGKTRVALACVRELASRGASVVLLGHAYRARTYVRTARIVSPHDTLEDVGDEALACARDLASDAACARARVIVGPTRQAAIDFAASQPDVDAIVIDGPLQLAPVRSSLALLAVDADAPWGAGDVAPAGDLRAPREALMASADHVVSVDATPRAALLDGETITLDALASSLSRSRSRIGLFTAIARPERLERALIRAGLAPSRVVRAADHGPLTARLAREIDESDVEIWLATPKCALHLVRCTPSGIARCVDLRRPLAILDGSAALPAPIVAALARFVGAAPTWVA